MLGNRLHNRVDRVSGKAKEWTGRATGNARREREGRIQAGLAYAKIKLSAAAKKIMKMVQGFRSNRRRR